MIETGKILQERYKIDKQIGQGGMGAVYVATDERFGSTVAIKQTLCMDDNYRKAIEREARLLNSLKHTALPRVSDHFLEDNGQFLVMEFIPGEDLCCILEDQGRPFESDQVLKWADQLLDALDFLHNQENPVIHRDIKPQNLKVTPKGQIVLLDFGLAKGNPTESNYKTAAKSIFGYSRNYASLEQIQGTGTDPRSDIYSLAATLYHLVTGVPPEDALTRAMAVLSLKPDPLRPAHLVNSDVPKGFSAILHSAMDLNADLRPASAEEMRSMLSEHERYSHLASGEESSEIAAPVPFHAQKTRILPAATVNDELRLTGAKTRLMTAEASQVTVARDSDSHDRDLSLQSGSPKKFAFAAGGLGIVLLGWAVVGGIYFYGPSGTSGERILENPAIPAPKAEEAALPETPANTDTGAVENVRAEAGRQAASENKGRITATADQKSVEATAAKASNVSPSVRVIQTEDGPIIIDGDKIIMGDKKIIGNRVITPQGEFMLREPPIPPHLMPRDGKSPPNFNGLSPEQRKKLIQTMRRYDANTEVKPPPRPPNQ